jgi:hypothetical protein
MSRKIFLLKYPAPPKQRGHFAIWVPSDGNRNIGKIVQVLGTPFTGFVLDIQRDFDLGKAQPKPVVIELGSIADEHDADDNIRHLPDTEAAAVGKLESVARTVTPPGPSKNPLIADSVGSKFCSLEVLGSCLLMLVVFHAEREQEMPRVDCGVC